MKQKIDFNESKVEHFNYDIKEKNLFKDILMYMRSQFHTEDTPVNYQDSGELLIWCYPFNEFEIFIKVWKNNYFLEFEPDGHKSKSIKYQGTSLEEFKNDLKDFIDNNNLTPYEYLSESKLQEMDFRYKAKVDKKWLKGRSLTDKKEDATEFESESEPTQIINQLKRDGKIPQKATIKIVKKRESTEVNMNYENIYREGKIKEFGPTYYYNLMAKYSEKLCDAKNDLEEAFFEYIHDAFWYASESIKSAQYKFYLRQLITEPSSIEHYHGEDFEEENAYDFKQFIKDPIKNENILKKYLNKEDIPAWENLKNLFSDDKSYERFNKKYKKEREDSEVKRAESEAKFKQETKPLDDAIKSVGLEIFYFEYFNNINEFAFVINTEDEYDAENARDEVAKVLNGAADNAYGASYDDIEGMGDVHLGCMQFYEFSEMNGGDRYEDLDEDYRDKYVIFACPKQKWINYRRMTDY